MAGVRFHGTSGEVSLSAATAKTPIEITAAANQRVLVKGIEVFFKGTSSTDTPVPVVIKRMTTTGTGTTLTFEKNNEGDDETIQTSGKINDTVEPTYGNTIKTWEIHPQTGLILFFPFGDELVIKGGNKIGIQVTAAQAQTVVVNLYLEE